MSRTVRDQLDLEKWDPRNDNLEDINPLDIDISEFEDVKDSLPEDGQLSIAIATGLAAQYLRAADRCSEILSMLTWWEQRAKSEKKRIYSLAWLRARENGARTDTMAKHMAEADDEYRVACEAETNAITVREHFRVKHQTFLKAHHYMKDRMKEEQQHMYASGFSETHGEGSWE